ncbi:membrane protein [Labrys miyagiensis]
MIADRLLTLIGCLFGAAGIVLMALAAHGRWPEINYAAVMVLAHAPVLLGIAVAIRLGLLRDLVARPAAFVLAAAVALFSGDVALHAVTEGHLFPMAAPTGGTVSILAWLMLALSAAMAR